MDDKTISALITSSLGITKPTRHQLQVVGSYVRQLDAIFCAPTGYGKSVTFQIAPQVTGKNALIVTPLIALAQDSVQKIRNLKLGQATSTSEENVTVNDLMKSRFVFSTPESLLEGRKLRFLIYIVALLLSLVGLQ